MYVILSLIGENQMLGRACFIFATQPNFYAYFIDSLFLPCHKIPKNVCIYSYISQYFTPDLNILKQSKTWLYFEILSCQMNLTQSWLNLLIIIRFTFNCLTYMWKYCKQDEKLWLELRLYCTVFNMLHFQCNSDCSVPLLVQDHDSWLLDHILRSVTLISVELSSNIRETDIAI